MKLYSSLGGFTFSPHGSTLTFLLFVHIFFVYFLHRALQIEGPRSPEQMLEILQRVVEESAPALVAARLEAEERRNAIRLREEQDAAYRAALEADQVHYSPNFLFL